jgi:FkbM family methyltransferase
MERSTKYYSQRGEDRWLMDNYSSLFSNGTYTYLDIGAADAEVNSNTRILDDLPNWSGVCYEPNPIYDNSYAATGRNRIKKAVTATYTGTIGFDFNGIPEIGKIGGNDIVPCISVKDLIERWHHFDLVSIDVEGLEYDIITELLKYDEPKLIIAEYNTMGKYNLELLNHIVRNGYKLLHLTDFNFIYGKE